MNQNVASKADRVRKNHVISDDTIVAHVNVSHQKAIIAHLSQSAALNSA